MFPVTSGDFKEYVVWLMAIAIVIVGVRHAKQAVVYVLDKLYEVFIQNAPRI